MNCIKKSLSLLTLGLCLCAGVSQAQFYGGLYGSQKIGASSFPTNYLTSTNFVISPAANATVSGVQIYNSRNVGFSLEAAGLTNAATGTATIAIVRSLDGVNWETSPFAYLSLTVPAATSGAGRIVTNIDFGGVGWFSLYSFTNSVTLTNVAVRYSIKPGF